MDFKKVHFKKSIKFDIQRRVVSHMTTTSWHHVPHVSYIYEPDITDFYNEFRTLSQGRRNAGHKITFNTIMIKTITEGLLSSPVLNSYIEYNFIKAEGTIHIADNINISIPWVLPDGRMITPVIFNAQKMSLDDISDYILCLSKKIDNTNINELLYRAAVDDTINEIKNNNISILRRILALKLSTNRVKGLTGKEKEKYYRIPENKRLTVKDIVSGTVTVSNIGSLYKEQSGFLSLLEIIPPQVFAIGIGSIQEKPGVHISKDGYKEICIRKYLSMCLVFDHRAVDFRSVVPFIKRLDEIFAKPNIIQKW